MLYPSLLGCVLLSLRLAICCKLTSFLGILTALSQSADSYAVAHRTSSICQARRSFLRTRGSNHRTGWAHPTYGRTTSAGWLIPEHRKSSVRINILGLRSAGTSVQRLSDAALFGSSSLASHHTCQG